MSNYSTHSNTKTNNPWFTSDCKIARAELRRANKAYRVNRSFNTQIVLAGRRRHYRKIKNTSKFNYTNKQKNLLHNLSRINPKKFWDEIRRLKGSKKKSSSNLSADDFLTHFNNLFSADDMFNNLDINDRLSAADTIFNNVEQLDCLFTLEDVSKAILSLKRQKSAGADLLLPEMFIEGVDILSPVLCKLFNHMFENGIYPDSWTKGIIVPVPKKGNLNDVNNYRGITLTSIFSKIFSILLDTRLRKWANDNNILTDFQFGF